MSNGRKVSYRKRMKIFKWFDRVNFWDPDFKINYRLKSTKSLVRQMTSSC